MPEQSHNKLLHHIATGAGFLGLMAYYLLIEKTGFFEWMTALMPEQYSGAGLMLAIMISMTPGFYIWKHYNRWVERALNVKGKYLEDEYYKAQEQQNKTDPDT